MQNLRKQINEIDWKIIKLLIKRMSLVKKIGKFKKKTGLLIQDKNRENELKDGLKKIAGEKLSPEFINKVYDVILKEARRVQNKD